MSEASATTIPTLPTPDFTELLADSDWAARRPGLVEHAAAWQLELPAVRAEAAADAARLATPRIWPDTIGSLVSTGWKIVSSAAPDAPVALLGAAATACGLPVAPPRSGDGTLKRARQLVESSGPAYIKLGQFIATARGLLPDEWVDAFAWCRDEAPPLEPGVAERTIQRELGAAASRLTWIDPEPMAAGSIGQAHRARLDDGTDVVVKVRRPQLRPMLEADLETLALLAPVAEKVHPAARIANLTGFVELFAGLVLEELDFRLEALNMVESALSFEDAGLDDITVPRPIPGMVTDGVLVMEFVEGVSYDRARATFGVELDGDAMLESAVVSVLEMTLVYGLFHGDLHAGNVLIDEGDSFGLIDFGICGRLDAEQRAALIRFLLAFAANDAAVQIDAMRAFGAVPPGADTAALAADLQAELDRLDAPDAAAITFDTLGETLGRVLRILSSNGFRQPKELVLFFKNLLYLAGFTASIAPDADLFALVGPVMARMQARHGDAMAQFAGGGAEAEDIPLG